MKFKFLPFFLLFVVTSCDQPLIKELTIDGSLLYQDLVTDEEKGFSLNSLQFFSYHINVSENDEFVFLPGGYIKSYHGIPYSNMVVESDNLTVCIYDYFDLETEDYVNIETIDFDTRKSSENKYTYYIGGKSEFMILNQSTNDITISNLYFYSND